LVLLWLWVVCIMFLVESENYLDLKINKMFDDM